jgi:hypothetical protein
MSFTQPVAGAQPPTELSIRHPTMEPIEKRL